MKKLYFLLFLAFSSIANAQIVNIPNANFKAKLLSASASNTIAKNLTGIYTVIDTNGDGEIQVSEAQTISFLNISNSQITDLTGIEAFVNLNELYCYNNQLTVLDVSQNVSLSLLHCHYNQLTILDVSANANLIQLVCVNNQLTSLDVSANVNLNVLYCHTNQLTSLNVSSNVNLNELYCDNNQLTSLDVSSNVNLNKLVCGNNQLTSLDVSANVNLNELYCSNNQLTSLNVSSNLNLSELHCHYNQLTSLNVSSNVNLTNLNCHTNQLTGLGVSSNVNLTHLSCNNNQLTSLDVSSNVNLNYLYCSNNQLTSLDVSSNVNLNELYCHSNQLSNLDVSSCLDLFLLYCDNNQLTSLDVSQNVYLDYLSCSVNQLTYLNIKNGSSLVHLDFNNNPDLEYICADDFEVADVQQLINNYGYTNCHVNSYCIFTPGGTFYEISGNTKFDFNNNSCEINDINYSNLKFEITDGINSGNMIANTTGDYYIPIQAGNHTVTPVLENPSYFTISPPSFVVDFPIQASPFTQDFCVTPSGVHSDVEIVLIPTTPARPGFDAHYRFIYRNIGNQVENGEVIFKYSDDVLDYVSSSIVFDSQTFYGTETTLHWNYSNLLPFETRTIDVVLNVNSPTETPAVNNGDVLGIFSEISTTNTDEDLSNNSSSLRQVVVGSYDPNDKTCVEGESVDISMVGEYVHYVIRFENTGTYPAENIVVKDMIDISKFDITTLVPLHGSHDFFTRINGNKVEFIFENINLDFNDATNDGYVVFKIKTLPTLTVGDTFSNEASIYFDYNFPIITNEYVTTIQNVLTNQDFAFENEFVLYPNPATAILNISTKNQTEIQSVEIYNIVGQVVIAIPNTTKTINVSSLETGTYFIKVNSEKGSTTTKFVKE